MTFTKKQSQVKDLLHKTNFLKVFTDENNLVANIEHELSKITAITIETHYNLKGNIMWSYTISGYHEKGCNNQNRLQSLLDQMKYFII